MVNRDFNYPVKLKKQPEGGYLVNFTNLPEAITQGENIADALKEAEDCLEEAIANRISMGLLIPRATKAKNKEYVVSLSATLAAKAALYIAIKDSKMNKATLAKKINCDEKEVRRLLDPHYKSKVPNIENALHKLGCRLNVEMVNYTAQSQTHR